MKCEEIEKIMDFAYGYLILKSYFFLLKTELRNEEYPNKEYLKKWREFLDEVDYNVLLNEAFMKIKNAVNGSSLDIYDNLDKASYFALIHPNHPSITLGFIKDADLWDVWLHNQPFDIIRDAVADNLSLADGDKVIDFGCGSVSPVYYGSIVGPNGIYTGIDYSKPLLDIAEARVKEQKLDWVRLRHARVDSKLLFKRTYDYVVCTSILEYIENTRAVLRNAAEALNYDGVMIVFSKLFKDLEPEKYGLMKLYYSLIPSFNDFPSVSEILKALDSMGIDYGYKQLSKHFLRIEFKGR
ncbi:hypothetical protein DRP04_12170 [Archaeoglobales archaeon]|nr:MAG: hypothetical protein DRP04_12170 [Archaeoglobales archaeon]